MDTRATDDLRDKLAEMLHQTAEDHHVEYRETDGVDPDWAIWYAPYLLEMGFDKLLNASILRSDLIYLLVKADKEQRSEAPGAAWERYYADFFLDRYMR